MRALSGPREVNFPTSDDMRFANYRSGLDGFIVSSNCLSSQENTLKRPKH